MTVSILTGPGNGIRRYPGPTTLNEIHDFDDTVVAILHDLDKARRVANELSEAGYDFELLEGPDGRDHLDVSGESGPGATLKRLLNMFGDQYRLIERLGHDLDLGKVVVSVEAKPDEADRAVAILQDNDGEFIWKLGTWTFTQIGE